MDYEFRGETLKYTLRVKESDIEDIDNAMNNNTTFKGIRQYNKTIYYVSDPVVKYMLVETNKHKNIFKPIEEYNYESV
jgi:hypothetical protein